MRGDGGRGGDWWRGMVSSQRFEKRCEKSNSDDEQSSSACHADLVRSWQLFLKDAKVQSLSMSIVKKCLRSSSVDVEAKDDC